MPEIKTRDVVSGTIKTLDRNALAGQRMKDAYVQAKDKAEHSVYSSESNSEEYAAEQITNGASTAAREAVHQVDVQGQKIIRGTQGKCTQRWENPQPQQSPLQSTQGSPQPSPNTPASTSPQTAQNTLGTKNIPNAQQPHWVIPDGAVTPTNSVDSLFISITPYYYSMGANTFRTARRNRWGSVQLIFVSSIRMHFSRVSAKSAFISFKHSQRYIHMPFSK